MSLPSSFERNECSKALYFGSLTENEEISYESLDDIFSILPIVKVTEQNNIIRIQGFSARYLTHDIAKQWNSNRTVNNLFIEINARSLIFHSFFAIEILYILEALIDERHTRSDRMTLETLRDAIKTQTWVKRINEPFESQLNRGNLKRLNVDLLQNQDEFLDAIDEKTVKYGLQGQILASPAGTGKTIAGFATSLALDADCTVFFVPNNSIDEVWRETIESRFKKTPKYWISSDKGYPTGDEEFIIVHYEFIVKLLPLIGKLRTKKRLCLWIDESHNFTDLKAARTKAIVQIATEAEAIMTVWASGTPFKAMGGEVVPILRSICRDQFSEEVEKQFLGIFGATRGRALDILQNRIGTITYKIDKKKIVDNKVIETDMYIEIPDGDRFTVEAVSLEIRNYVVERVKHYTALRREYVVNFERLWDKFAKSLKTQEEKQAADLYLTYVDKMHRSFNQREDLELMRYCKRYEQDNIYPFFNHADRKEFKHVVAVHKYMILVIRGEALGRILVRRRIECFEAMIEHANLEEIVNRSRKKTLIFSSYVQVVKKIEADLSEKKMQPIMVTGETNHEFETLMTRFRTVPKANPAIATYKSLSTAVPVTEASTVILTDPPFRDYIREQAISRLDRYGQDGPVIVVTLLLRTGNKENLSTRNKDIMELAKEIVDRMLGLDTKNIEDSNI